MITQIKETRAIPITIEKSHLVTIGEKLYTEKTSFIRELVNNAYDADATEVYVDILPSSAVIKDNGSGMDEEGLRQYFTIGSDFKKIKSISPKFGRKRIGEFGIGKFAALSACKKFEINTQKGNFRARLIFDKDVCARHEDWHINIDILRRDEKHGNGTIITLQNLNIVFMPGKVRRYLMERTPIAMPEFSVFLNGEKITDEIVTGRKIEFQNDTPYGLIQGKIIIVSPEKKIVNYGIAIMVKGVLIRYELFGLDTARRFGSTRVTGKVYADFLPITSGRDNFLRDAEEFLCFSETMKKEIKNVLKILKEEEDRKYNLQASRVLKDALIKIGKAIKKHKDLFPETQVPIGEKAEDFSTNEKGFKISEAKFLPSQTAFDKNLEERLKTGKNKKSGRAKFGILGSKSVIRKLRITNMDIAVRMEHLGNDEESLISGGVIYVNIDHPLYKTYQNNDELLTSHISRVITKELALQTGINDATRAFAIQSELLTDALKKND